MLRGEVWWGAWPNDPERKRRPLLIVSNNFRNQAPNVRDVTVVKITSLHKFDGTKRIVNGAEDVVVKFKKPSVIRCGAIFTVEKRWLEQKALQISAEIIQQVDACLKTTLDLN